MAMALFCVLHLQLLMTLFFLQPTHKRSRPRTNLNTIADVAGADKTRDGKASAVYKFSRLCTRTLIKKIIANQARKCVMELNWDACVGHAAAGEGRGANKLVNDAAYNSVIAVSCAYLVCLA